MERNKIKKENERNNGLKRCQWPKVRRGSEDKENKNEGMRK